jgi:thymidylate synthase (FAD)
VARQLGKHQVGFTWSEISRRYKTKGIEFFRPYGDWRKSSDLRQGTGELCDYVTQEVASEILNTEYNSAYKRYNQLLAMGVTPEQARFVLPQGMEVSWTWTGSLLAWSDLYLKRQHSDTQKETRDFVMQAAKIIRPLFPVSWEALTNG